MRCSGVPSTTGGRSESMCLSYKSCVDTTPLDAPTDVAVRKHDLHRFARSKVDLII